jgi:hypothetical protein
MTTASQYREYAQECIRDARTAASEPIRQQFLDLATLWMTAAARVEVESEPPTKGKLDGANRPGSAGAE